MEKTIKEYAEEVLAEAQQIFEKAQIEYRYAEKFYNKVMRDISRNVSIESHPIQISKKEYELPLEDQKKSPRKITKKQLVLQLLKKKW